MTDVVTSIATARRRLDDRRAEGVTVGLVPTMGFLHSGHGSLMEASVAANDLTMVTIFVNPLQFAADEDLDDYPRDLARDVELCAAQGVDLVLNPPVEEMYPEPVLTTVSVPSIAAPFEGHSRPTHFDGVATVVAKLFSIAAPCRAYFGEKDYQQLAIVRRLAFDLSMPVEVVGCPIVREDDGLAMSSRNHYLSVAERAAAPVLKAALDAGRETVEAGETSVESVRRTMTEVVAGEPLAQLDYAAVVDPETIEIPEVIDGPVRLLIAVQVGKPRLLDNMAATPRGLQTS